MIHHKNGWLTEFTILMSVGHTWHFFVIVAPDELEEKIKALCNHAITAEGAELQEIFARLREALQ